MTKDNASGAGMGLPPLPERFGLWHYEDAAGTKLGEPEAIFNSDQLFAFGRAAQADATRLLAESQAHNAKLEAQAERLREALQVLCDEQDAREGYASIETYDKARTALAGFPAPTHRSPDVELVAGVLRTARNTHDMLGSKALAEQVLQAQSAFERIAALKP